MITKQISTKRYILEEKDINIIKGALEYCRHRIKVHFKCKHLNKERIDELIDQFYD